MIVDNENPADVFRDFLMEKEYEPILCVNGKNPLEIYQKIPSAIILANVNKFNIDDCNFCKRLRSLPHGDDVFLIAMITDKSEDMLRHILAMGFDDYIVKPFLLDDLELRLNVARQHFILRQEKKRSEERFKQMADLSPLPFVILDLPSSQIEYLNQKFTDILGYTAEEIPTLDASYEKLYPDPIIREGVRSLWESDIIGFKSSTEIERQFNVTCKNGEVRTVVFRVVVNGDQKVFFILEDITEKERVTLQLKEKMRT